MLQRGVDSGLSGTGVEGQKQRTAGIHGHGADGGAAHDQAAALGQGSERACSAEHILGIGAAVANQGERGAAEIVGGGELGVEDLDVAVEHDGCAVLDEGGGAVEGVDRVEGCI